MREVRSVTFGQAAPHALALPPSASKLNFGGHFLSLQHPPAHHGHEQASGTISRRQHGEGRGESGPVLNPIGSAPARPSSPPA